MDLYAEGYHPDQRVVFFDERSCQSVADTLEPLLRKPGRAKRGDYEYERRGVCNAVVIFQSPAGWREVKVTARRTKQDFFQIMREVVEVHFPQTEKIRLVI